MTNEKVLQSQAFVRSQFASTNEFGQRVEATPEDSSEVIQISKFETEPAQVKVEYGTTINLGNFESAKIGVAVTIPCYKEEIDAAYDFATKWAEKRIMKEQDAINKSIRERREAQF